MLKSVIDNIFVRFGERVFQQTVGILMVFVYMTTSSVFDSP
jgi:hypothetical protein